MEHTRGMRNFDDLSEREILALAIERRRRRTRLCRLAEGLRQDFPATAAIFDGMGEEESGHRRRLIELFYQNLATTFP